MKADGKTKNEGAKLGSRPVLAEVMLGVGLTGLIVALESQASAEQSVRREEVIELMSDALERYDFVETGVLPGLMEEIALSTLAVTDSNPKEYSFHSALPLRRAADRGNYFDWNPDQHSWVLKPFLLKNLSIKGDKIMLIVKEKTKQSAPEAVAA